MNSDYEIINKEGSVVTVRHIKCGKTFVTTEGTFRCMEQLEICPHCYNHFETKFVERLGMEYEITNINFIPNRSFVNQQIELRHLCERCNFHTRKVTPHTLANTKQTWCPVCRKAEKGDDFESKVKSLVGNEYSVMGTYKGAKTKIKMRHNVCGHTWEVRPDNFLGNVQKEGSRCPRCMRMKKSDLWEHKEDAL